MYLPPVSAYIGKLKGKELRNFDKPDGEVKSDELHITRVPAAAITVLPVFDDTARGRRSKRRWIADNPNHTAFDSAGNPCGCGAAHAAFKPSLDDSFTASVTNIGTKHRGKFTEKMRYERISPLPR